MPLMQTHMRHGIMIPDRMVQVTGLLFERLSRSRLLARFAKRQLTGTIVTVPPMIHKGNPEYARQAYLGEFSFKAGTLATNTISPFHMPGLPDAMARELTGFTWLHHLQTTDSEISRAYARRLIGDWIAAKQHNRVQAWQPRIIARRLVAWLTAAPFYLKNAPAEFNNMLLDSIMTQTAFLAFTAHRMNNGADRLEALIGLAITALCLDGKSRILTKTLTHLEHELNTQVLADGGHINRTPSSVLNCLNGLIVLHKTMLARNYVVPKNLLSAIDRMLPMLRFFQLGDRGLAYFHGNNAALAQEVSQVLSDNPNSGQPLGHARHSGFQRLDLGKTIIIMDAGAPPSSSASKNSHASCLAFEMSHGPHRIIVNCGAADDPHSDWYDAASSTAAHSTLTLEDINQNFAAKQVFWRKWLGMEQKPAPASSSRRNDKPGSILVEAEHDGYLTRLGLRHRRRLYLSNDGNDLRGEDIIRAISTSLFTARPQPHAFAIRFHLHPDVKVTRAQSPNSILLLLPDHTGWTFTVAGAELELAETIYLSDQSAPKRSQQIVLHGTVEKQSQIKWALKRLDKTNRRKPKTNEQSEYLPLIDA